MSEKMMDVERAAFEEYVLGREHPVIGWIDRHWFTPGDDPAAYANDYVQGCWVMWQARASQPVGVPDGWLIETGFDVVDRPFRFVDSNSHTPTIKVVLPACGPDDSASWDLRDQVAARIGAMLTATPAPEARGAVVANLQHECARLWSLTNELERSLAARAELAEQGERQEAQVIGRVHLGAVEGEPVRAVLNSIGRQLPDNAPLYTTQQLGPDVRGLAGALYQACGAYDMPERILDVLSAAANGEPFTHMIAGLLPCVPPVESGVEGLVEALEQIADARETPTLGDPNVLRVIAFHALAAHRQAQRQA